MVSQVSEWRHGEVSYDEAGSLVIKPLPEQTTSAATHADQADEEEEGEEEDEGEGTAEMLTVSDCMQSLLMMAVTVTCTAAA